MKRIRKIAALVLAAVMVMAMGITAFAANDGSIIVTNATAGQTYKAYKIFTASPSNPDDVTSDIIYTATEAQTKITGFDTFFDKALDEADILYNSRNYPLDEAPSAYKNFEEVLRSVESAGLARCVARLHAKFVIKDSYSKPDD